MIEIDIMVYDLDLSNLLRWFDLTWWKDDRIMEMMFFVTILYFIRWPHTAIFFTLLYSAQIHFDFVPQDHNYWNGLAVQAAAATWLLSMQLGKLSETFVSYCTCFKHGGPSPYPCRIHSATQS